uniref:MULE transposase domain-containing protein n=1 Tax=Globodera rostochiensis TaxID=31243 RepID=A0A914GWL3_GLORO
MQRNYTNAKRRYQEEVGDVFESCPRGFAQLYTMSAIIDHCAVPCVYGVLPNKERATYACPTSTELAHTISPGCRISKEHSIFTELILYFVNTWLGPRHIIENEEPLHDPHGQNMGGVADGWIRGRIEAMNLGHRDALFPIPLWNMVDRVAQGLSRTNNSLECWHGVWNVHLREDGMWEDRLADFHAAPADGIRGPHQIRKGKYVRQDNNLTALLADFNNREPLAYLRAVSYHYDYCRNYPLKQSKLEE